MNNYLVSNKNNQFFCYTTYRWVPPTFKHYKLFVVSSYDFKEQKLFICAYCLIPNEFEDTYEFIFKKLKENFGFNPLLIISDFSKSITNALKLVFLNCIQIRCLFHFIKALNNKSNNMGLNTKDNIRKVNEILFNLELLAFISPKNIKDIYLDIEKNYNDEGKFGAFLDTLKNSGNLMSKIRN